MFERFELFERLEHFERFSAVRAEAYLIDGAKTFISSGNIPDARPKAFSQAKADDKENRHGEEHHYA